MLKTTRVSGETRPQFPSLLKWDSSQGFGGLLRPPSACATCGANWTARCWGLKPTSKDVGPGAPWEGPRCRFRSPSACDRPGTAW